MCSDMLTLHGPVEDGGGGDHSDGGGRDPFPEDYRLGQLVRLHLRLHLHVEDLEVVACLQGNHLGNGIHDGRIGCDRTALRLLRSCHVDDDNLHLAVDLLANANVLLALHGQRREADKLRVDAHIRELDQLQSPSKRRGGWLVWSVAQTCKSSLALNCEQAPGIGHAPPGT